MKHNINKGDSFTCTVCREEFISTWNQEDSDAEYQRRFPDRNNEQASVVCEECYQQYLKWKESGSKLRSVN